MEKIIDKLEDIDVSSIEGRLLTSAVMMLSQEWGGPDKVISQLNVFEEVEIPFTDSKECRCGAELMISEEHKFAKCFNCARLYKIK